jgi:hypothetical protein
MNKTQLKAKLVKMIMDEFDHQGYEFTCLASFNQVRDFSRQLANDAYDKHGFMFSNSNYFPVLNGGDNLQFWASKEYLKTRWVAA